MNPTSTALDVYAAFFTNEGAFIPGKCFKKKVLPNAKWYLRATDLNLSEFDTMGTAEFVAIPAGSLRKTPDTTSVIGGYQNRWVFEMTSSQADLKGVNLILSTMGAFTSILNKTCIALEGPR
jgi:hypothetical protein